jgi:hypothetical protein
MKWDARRSPQVRSCTAQGECSVQQCCAALQNLGLKNASAQFYDEVGRKKIATGAALP